MQFLLLLSGLLFAVGAVAPQVSAASKKELTGLTKQIFDLYIAIMPKTPAEKARYLCLIEMCRLVDNKECTSNCTQWAAMVDPAVQEKIPVVEDEEYIPTEAECSTTCAMQTSDVPKAEKLCTPLCHNLYSYTKYKEYLTALKAASVEASAALDEAIGRNEK